MDQPLTNPTDTKSLLRRLDGTAAYSLTLRKRTALSPSVVALVLEGEIDSLHPAPGNDLMFGMTLDGTDGSFRRRYSIRKINHETASLELWIETRAGGPGSQWALNAPIGSTIEAIGPRGKVILDPMADWHLFIGDLTFLPAAYAMAESIDPPGQALFIWEIDDTADALLPKLDDQIGVTVGFVERSNRAFNDPTGLLRSLEALELPRDEGHIYVGGELSVVAAIKKVLLQRGFSTDAVSAKPYWRMGVANLAHGEPKKDAAP
jgi:NADPH-dependent ferric siderophore reductase